jgi:small multidrug resistance pump
MKISFSLLLAVIFEVIATTALKSSEQFTRFWPSVVVVVGYGAAIYLMTIALRTMPVGVVYAIWSGLGIVLVSLLSYFFYRQALDWPAIIGIGMIVGGVLTIHLFSKAVA